MIVQHAWVYITNVQVSMDDFLFYLQAFVALGQLQGWYEDGVDSDYPMDYYASAGGAYNSSYHKPKSHRTGNSMPGFLKKSGKANMIGS